MNRLKIVFFFFYSIIEKLDGCTNLGEKIGIELFTGSHVERKKSNKNYETSRFKHVREKIGQNSRSVMQEFMEIISL